MMRFFFYFLTFSLFLLLEYSFVHALPAPLNSLPIMLIFSVFFYQYLGLEHAIWWLFFTGLYIDAFGLSIIPAETFVYSLCALVLFVTSKRLFTNRSFYGVAGSVLMLVLVLFIGELSLSGIARLVQSGYQPARALLVDLGWSSLLSVVFLFFFFPLAKRIKLFVRHLIV